MDREHDVNWDTYVDVRKIESIRFDGEDGVIMFVSGRNMKITKESSIYLIKRLYGEEIS